MVRIGYVSPDFKNHPVALAIQPIFRYHCRSQFLVFAYNISDRQDDKTAELQKLVGVGWRDCRGQSWVRTYHQILEDKIDVLVDLAGNTLRNQRQIFERRGAPVQITWLGDAFPTNIDNMDYRITSQYTVEHTCDAKWPSETLLMLPHFYQPYQQCENTGYEPDRIGIDRTGVFTFLMPHRPEKMSTECIWLYADIMRRVPKSMAMVNTYRDEDRILSEFYDAGVSPNRIMRMPLTATRNVYLSMYNKTCIVLDAFPYTGCTTTMDALSMGVPVVTLLGDDQSSVCSADILQEIGATSLISKTQAEFIHTAVALATEEKYLTLRYYKSSLKEMFDQSIICRGEDFTRSYEGIIDMAL